MAEQKKASRVYGIYAKKEDGKPIGLVFKGPNGLAVGCDYITLVQLDRKAWGEVSIEGQSINIGDGVRLNITHADSSNVNEPVPFSIATVDLPSDRNPGLTFFCLDIKK